MAEVRVTKQTRPEVPVYGNFFGVSPFTLMRQFTDEMDRAFGATAWVPTVEVKEKDGKLFVSADLPGINKEDVKVSVVGDQLTIEGERKSEKEEKGDGFYHSERSYGAFSRVIPLPEGANGDAAVAQFNNGILEISMPMIAAKKTPLEIKVQDAPKAQASVH